MRRMTWEQAERERPGCSGAFDRYVGAMLIDVELFTIERWPYADDGSTCRLWATGRADGNSECCWLAFDDSSERWIPESVWPRGGGICAPATSVAPTNPPGLHGPLGCVVIHTGTHNLYVKSGPGATDWKKVSGEPL